MVQESKRQGRGSRSRKWQETFSQSVQKAWYSDGGWVRCLLPLTWLFNWVAKCRRQKYLQAVRWQPPVAVVVVGNITVGGTGKTPVVTSIIKALKAKGFRPGIASRGFAAQGVSYPLLVTKDSSPTVVGDEPVMLAQQLDVPVVVDPDRVSAVKTLIEQNSCDLVVTDDGLQHYNLQRHVELVVIDGDRLLGNGLCLPSGPLREPIDRLSTVDLVLVNGTPSGNLPVPFDCFYLEPGQLVSLVSLDDKEQQAPNGGEVHAVAGIGNPGRFFNTLESLGFKVIAHAFPDHHHFVPADLQFEDQLPVLMTAKDAVKCQSFAEPGHWYLPVQAHLPDRVMEQLFHLIATKGPQGRPGRGQG